MIIAFGPDQALPKEVRHRRSEYGALHCKQVKRETKSRIRASVDVSRIGIIVSLSKSGANPEERETRGVRVGRKKRLRVHRHGRMWPTM